MNKLLYNCPIKRFLFVAFALLFTLAGCEEEQEAITPKLFMDAEAISASHSAAEYSVDFVTNSPWQASADVDWISFVEESGEKGKHTLIFAVAGNEDDERVGKITVTASEALTMELQVTQDAGNTNDIYVKPDGSGDGTSWAEATHIAEALGRAVDGNTIHIAAGTYIPSVTVTGGDPADDGDKTFEISKRITLQGGYPENPGEDATPDATQYKPILSGAGTSYHVVTVSAAKLEGQKVVLRGLTITDGKAGPLTTSASINGVDFRRDYGGAIAIGNAIVDIIDTDIIGNASEKQVAGLYAFDGSVVTMKGCKVNNNISVGNAGGAWIRESTAYVYDSEFNGNEGGTAAGFHAYPDASVYLYNTVIADNKGRSYGAAFYARQNARGVLVNCLITGNSSTSANGGGGVMMYNNCEVTIINSTITKNTIAGPGGGVYRRSGTNVLSIYNSIISGNEQKAGSLEVDVYEIDAPAPVVQSSVITTAAFDQAGAEIAGAPFDVNTMLSAEYIPVGENNPALLYGMTPDQLGTLGASLDPTVATDDLSIDLYHNSRTGLTTMGAIVQ